MVNFSRKKPAKSSFLVENVSREDFDNIDAFAGAKSSIFTIILGLLLCAAGIGLFMHARQNGWFVGLYFGMIVVGLIITISSFVVMRNLKKIQKQLAMMDNEQFYDDIRTNVITLFNREGFNTKTRAQANLLFSFRPFLHQSIFFITKKNMAT